jgi:hypothetical protein
MQQFNQNQLNEDIATIQILHARLGNDLAKSMAYGTGNFMFISQLNKRNILISVYRDILYRYEVIGDTDTTEYYNVLTMDDIQAIIDDCYRELEKYNT